MEPEKIAPEMKSIIKLVKQDGVEKRPNRTSNYADLNIAILESAATKKPAKVTAPTSPSNIALEWSDQGGLQRLGHLPCAEGSVVNGTKAPAGEVMLRYLGWPQAWGNATVVRCGRAGPLTCRCAAVQVDPNLSKSERPIEAVRRGKWGCGM
ncbi:TPA: hypothetical protein ACH3X1_014309 [Trebouxia sp. C0004]